MKYNFIIWMIFLFSFNSIAQISFERKRIGANWNAPIVVHSVDIDNDDDFDVIESTAEGKIVWFENTNGSGDFKIKHIVYYNVTVAAVSLFAEDIDNDGDIDIIVAFDNNVAWFENIDGDGTFSTKQIITTNTDVPTSVFVVDLDGDGDMDVLSSSEGDNKIVWFENVNGQGVFSSQQIISTNAVNAKSVYAADLDSDGDMDVLSASEGDNKVAWYENINGQGTFSSEQIITTSTLGANDVYTADIDGDGDMDVLSASEGDNKVAWYENLNGQGAFGTQQIIDVVISYPYPHTVSAIDIDGDGDEDVISNSSWYENTNGQGAFLKHAISPDIKQILFVADIDGDNDLDMFSFYSPYVLNYIKTFVWNENIDGQGNFSLPITIDAQVFRPSTIYAEDFDGDGDMDVVVGAKVGNKIIWYENLDGQGDFGNINIVSMGNDIVTLYAIDFDGDNDVDILSGSFESDEIAWYENLDGFGNFGLKQVISTNTDGVFSVFAVDIDGDGDMDVLSASKLDNKIAWYENLDGNGTFGSQQIIMANANGANSVYAADLDGDGDMDVLSASYIPNDNNIAWYENINGQGAFGSQQIISTSVYGANSVFASDIDGDGDMDVLSSSRADDKIAWYENEDGLGDFSSQNVISINLDRPVSVNAADIDGDGDKDVLCSTLNGVVAWFENINGLGAFGIHQQIYNLGNNSYPVVVSDINNNGKIDVLSVVNTSHLINWFQNLGILSVNENKKTKFLVYPNPITDVLYVNSDSKIIQIDIYNQIGQLVLDNIGKQYIKLSGLNKGLYFVKLKDENGFVDTKIIIKK